MLKEKMMQEIQNLKLQSYTPAQIIHYYLEKGQKPPTPPMIRKYYRMDVLPDNPEKNLQKDKVFDQESFHSMIIKVLCSNANNKLLCVSSIYDVLLVKFIENGDYDEYFDAAGSFVLIRFWLKSSFINGCYIMDSYICHLVKTNFCVRTFFPDYSPCW